MFPTFLYFVLIPNLVFNTIVISTKENSIHHVKSNETVQKFNPEHSRLYYQIGTPRSGSTFQWYTICSILRILFPYRTNCNSMVTGKKEFILRKEHDLNFLGNVVTNPSVKINDTDKRYFFISQNKTSYDLANELLIKNDSRNVIVYIQEYDDLIQKDISILKIYAKIFSLNEEQYLILYQHIRYWSIIRRCCGFQQSISHRNILHNQSIGNSFLTLEYPACEMYKLNTVENLFLQTTLSKKFVYNLYISYSGGFKFDSKKLKTYVTIYKGYCENTEKLIKSGLDFNGEKIKTATNTVINNTSIK